MKQATVIAIIALIVAVSAFVQTGRISDLEQRLKTVEDSLETLEPLRALFAANRVAQAGGHPAYSAEQLLGAPNVPDDATDHPAAWCPAEQDRGEEWLLLEYRMNNPATAIEIHGNLNPGTIIAGSIVQDDDSETIINLPTEKWRLKQRIARIDLPAPQSIHRLRLKLDTRLVPGWNEIDSVGLVDGEGAKSWPVAVSASCSWAHATPPPQSNR